MSNPRLLPDEVVAAVNEYTRVCRAYTLNARTAARLALDAVLAKYIPAPADQPGREDYTQTSTGSTGSAYVHVYRNGLVVGGAQAKWARDVGDELIDHAEQADAVREREETRWVDTAANMLSESGYVVTDDARAWVRRMVALDWRPPGIGSDEPPF